MILFTLEQPNSERKRNSVEPFYVRTVEQREEKEQRDLKEDVTETSKEITIVREQPMGTEETSEKLVHEVQIGKPTSVPTTPKHIGPKIKELQRFFTHSFEQDTDEIVERIPPAQPKHKITSEEPLLIKEEDRVSDRISVEVEEKDTYPHISQVIETIEKRIATEGQMKPVTAKFATGVEVEESVKPSLVEERLTQLVKAEEQVLKKIEEVITFVEESSNRQEFFAHLEQSKEIDSKKIHTEEPYVLPDTKDAREGHDIHFADDQEQEDGRKTITLERHIQHESEKRLKRSRKELEAVDTELSLKETAGLKQPLPSDDTKRSLISHKMKLESEPTSESRIFQMVLEEKTETEVRSEKSIRETFEVVEDKIRYQPERGDEQDEHIELREVLLPPIVDILKQPTKEIRLDEIPAEEDQLTAAKETPLAEILIHEEAVFPSSSKDLESEVDVLLDKRSAVMEPRAATDGEDLVMKQEVIVEEDELVGRLISGKHSDEKEEMKLLEEDIVVEKTDTVEQTLIEMTIIKTEAYKLHPTLLHQKEYRPEEPEESVTELKVATVDTISKDQEIKTVEAKEQQEPIEKSLVTKDSDYELNVEVLKKETEDRPTPRETMAVRQVLIDELSKVDSLEEEDSAKHRTVEEETLTSRDILPKPEDEQKVDEVPLTEAAPTISVPLKHTPEDVTSVEEEGFAERTDIAFPVTVQLTEASVTGESVVEVERLTADKEEIYDILAKREVSEERELFGREVGIKSGIVVETVESSVDVIEATTDGSTVLTTKVILEGRMVEEGDDVTKTASKDLETEEDGTAEKETKDTAIADEISEPLPDVGLLIKEDVVIDELDTGVESVVERGQVRGDDVSDVTIPEVKVVDSISDAVTSDSAETYPEVVEPRETKPADTETVHTEAAAASPESVTEAILVTGTIEVPDEILPAKDTEREFDLEIPEHVSAPSSPGLEATRPITGNFSG
ncbi:hypothetical protein L798_12870 [Zootermopsis nevadensis]|uniref:Uncharacterized protein n=1 Tax=Zootermopsis nevadensis TaxID=136037 RepID=A0A067QT34_ZOONE|nr:hypothetical protein L798_12870 [Zootermopsis nevadensis]